MLQPPVERKNDKNRDEIIFINNFAHSSTRGIEIIFIINFAHSSTSIAKTIWRYYDGKSKQCKITTSLQYQKRSHQEYDAESVHKTKQGNKYPRYCLDKLIVPPFF